MNKEFLVVIPARFKSTRFPGKPLADLNGKSMICRVWEKCVDACSKDSVLIATDDKQIEDHCLTHGMNVTMTSDKCKTGTDRVAEVSLKFEAGFYVNVQGDEPLIDPSDIKKVITHYKLKPNTTFCAMTEIRSEDEYKSPNTPKVVVNKINQLLYISRAGIPANKENSFCQSMKQVCIYAFPKEHLKEFGPDKFKTPLEEIEDIELLRLLEKNMEVQMVEVKGSSIAVDTPEDLEKVRATLND